MGAFERINQVKKALKELGIERERAAVALLALAFFGIVYLLVGLNAPPGWGPVFAALALCYLTAFLALASQWFWARWYASGLGWSGFMVGVMSLVMIGWQPALLVYTGLHALVIGMLMGSKMSALFELQPAWREKYGMDEYGVVRLGKAVTRASASLPTLIFWALAPREGQGGQTLAIVALLLAVAGLRKLVGLRTWGLAALAGAAVATIPSLFASLPISRSLYFYADSSLFWAFVLLAAAPVAITWLALALLPFVRPAYRFLRERG